MSTGPDLRNSTQGDWLDGWSPTCKRLLPAGISWNDASPAEMTR